MGLLGIKCYDNLRRDQEAKTGTLLAEILHMRFPP